MTYNEAYNLLKSHVKLMRGAERTKFNLALDKLKEAKDQNEKMKAFIDEVIGHIDKLREDLGNDFTVVSTDAYERLTWNCGKACEELFLNTTDPEIIESKAYHDFWDKYRGYK